MEGMTPVHSDDSTSHKVEGHGDAMPDNASHMEVCFFCFAHCIVSDACWRHLPNVSTPYVVDYQAIWTSVFPTLVVTSVVFFGAGAFLQ